MFQQNKKPQICTNEYSQVCIDFASDILQIVSQNIPSKFGFSFASKLDENDVESLQQTYN